MDSIKRYLNSYYCIDCNIYWDDYWDCMCNDKCPVCDKEIEPYESLELDDVNIINK